MIIMTNIPPSLKNNPNPIWLVLATATIGILVGGLGYHILLSEDNQGPIDKINKKIESIITLLVVAVILMIIFGVVYFV
tara:strand:- start:3083 stop:3319 length:237 start_codon:yes stop_codon:yes gene_type:complete